MASPWSRAAELAARTPASRNRYVDALRALSILVVIAGHWLAAAPYVDAQGDLRATHVLAVAPWTHWLTWVIQVMPVFFLVGGFSNGITWRAARRDGVRYADWLEGRLKRLAWPALPLVALWAAIGAVAHLAGASPDLVRAGSQASLIHAWFLAVYVGVAVLVPLTHSLWRRFGWGSFFGLAAAAVALDALFFAADLRALGWVNYLFVWSAVHQLGYAWSEGRIPRAATWIAALLGLGALLALTELGPYPRAMVGVPGEGISNTTPPKVTLLALALAQGGTLLFLEPLGKRILERAAPWTAAVLVNGMIMTIYMWHLTAMVLVIGLLYLLGGVGLRFEPASGAWWWFQIPWIAGLAVALLPFVAIFGRFERPKTRSGPAVHPARLVVGGLAICAGLAFLALAGVAGEGWLGLKWWAIALPFAGALLISFGRGGVEKRAAEAARASGPT